MHTPPPLSGTAPILAYFGGYAPADRRTYELFLVAENPLCLESMQTGTIPAVQPHRAALDALAGKVRRPEELRDQAYTELQRQLADSPLRHALDVFIAQALYASHRGLALRLNGTIVGSVRLFCYSLPELRGGSSQAVRLPDRIVPGQPVEHPQLWVPGVPLDRLPRRHHARAARETHPAWTA